MARCKGALLSLAAVLLCAFPAAAQIGGHPFEISGTAGIFSPDIRARMQTSPAYNAGLGWRARPGLSLELTGNWMPSKQDTTPFENHNFFYTGLDLRLNLRPAYRSIVPFLFGGGGYASSHTRGHGLDKLDRGAGTVGAGVLANMYDQRWYLRAQVRDVIFRDRDLHEFSNHFTLTAGLQYVFGGRAMDQDRDGVRDGLDQCPNTPLGAKVDARGCPSDVDGDAVLDGIDKCDDTPKGCTIDAEGCQKDADGDGICDGIDTCPDTPKGATVSATGCPSDVDGDTVLDGIDQCNDTPKGATVDARGCQSDPDQDGVPDGLDRCPNTPTGLKVDPTGCPIEVSERETELLDTGSIRVHNIYFDTNKATIKPESYPVIDEVARILQQYPTLTIEIGGHTDNTGTDRINVPLSQERADSVLAYLRARHPLLPAAQYTSRGYAAQVPVAPNTSALGRARNRRVEFRVTNTDVLRIERERRRFLRRDEPTPGGATPSPPPPSIPTSPAPSDTTGQIRLSPAPPDTTVRLPGGAPPDTTRR